MILIMRVGTVSKDCAVQSCCCTNLGERFGRLAVGMARVQSTPADSLRFAWSRGSPNWGWAVDWLSRDGCEVSSTPNEKSVFQACWCLDLGGWLSWASSTLSQCVLTLQSAGRSVFRKGARFCFRTCRALQGPSRCTVSRREQSVG